VVHALTFPLITDVLGNQDGQDAQGAVWLGPELTPLTSTTSTGSTRMTRTWSGFWPFSLFSHGGMRKLGALKGEGIREAKEVLAFEATALCMDKGKRKRRETPPESFSVEGDSRLPNRLPPVLSGRWTWSRALPRISSLRNAACARPEEKPAGSFRRAEAMSTGKESKPLTRWWFEGSHQRSILLRAGKKKYVRVIPG